jgi:2-iminobutanoate/2-iminopropanoate deaminase
MPLPSLRRRAAAAILATLGISTMTAAYAQSVANPERRALVSSQVAPPPVPALTSGLVDKDHVYISGQLAFKPEAKGIPADLDVVAQTEVVMQRIVGLLKAEGLTTADLLKVTIFYTDPNDLLAINGVYTKYVSEPFPARSSIGVAFLPLKGSKVEIEGVARRR